MRVFGLRFGLLFALEQRPLAQGTAEVPYGFSEGDWSFEGGPLNITHKLIREGEINVITDEQYHMG